VIAAGLADRKKRNAHEVVASSWPDGIHGLSQK